MDQQRGPVRSTRRGEGVLTETNELSPSSKAPTVDNVYAEISASVRTTDDISFKLLGLVPLISGGGIFLLLDASKQPDWSPVTIFIALFGAVVTFAIYRWEVRNIQTCNWLIARGAELEELSWPREQVGVPKGQSNRDSEPAELEELSLAREQESVPKGQFSNRDPEPRVLGWMSKPDPKRKGPSRVLNWISKLDRKGPLRVLNWKMGKTDAERLLYTVTIVAWLLLPIIAAVSD
jgi:hypothetical protein